MKFCKTPCAQAANSGIIYGYSQIVDNLAFCRKIYKHYAKSVLGKRYIVKGKDVMAGMDVLPKF